MAYQPQYLLPSQIGQESGGNQFDASGQPLTSSAGAIGVAQVMPATGPEAAAMAGLPWDEQKYKTDREYNMRIGDAYQGHLNQVFAGDSVAAHAAYNAGPTRVAKLKAKYGDQWASYLPPETKKYVKNVLGVNVDSTGTGSAPVSDNIASIAKNLGISLGDVSVGSPTPGEQANVQYGTGFSGGGTVPDVSGVVQKAADASTASDRYTSFLNGAIQPIVQNMQAQTEGYQKIATVKQGMADDFKMRESDLESKIQPLMAQREKILSQIQSLDSMAPLDRRMKAIFNPKMYDPRELNGQLERVEDQMKGLSGDYDELNRLRSGVAAASVDATSADVGALDAQRQSTMAEASLLGQVAGATTQQVSAALLPITASVDAMNLEQHQHAAVLGKLSTEETHALYNQAKASPDGTVNVQGLKFTVGELQKIDQDNLSVDLNLHNLTNASRTNDLMTADKVEDDAISHMSLEQLSDSLANGGMFRGVKLDSSKLAQAMSTAQQARNLQVNNVIAGTAQGQAHDAFTTQNQLIQVTHGRAQEMFGTIPQDLVNYEQQVGSFANQWTNGFKAAQVKGAGNEYVSTTMPQIQAMRDNYEKTVDGIATQWSGGNTNMKDVALAYLHGNPLNGDSAIKGLIAIARSGMPAGAKVSGPAAQAIETARSIVREFDNPQAGDSITAMLQGSTSQADKDRQLMNRVRASVGAVYANGVTDSLIQSFPALARTIRDPNNPGKASPFSRVNPDDFRMAIAHGDNSGYEALANEMGVNPQTAKIIFSKGVDSAEWQNLAKAKGWTNDKFATFLGALQSTQMSETLSALDASHSSVPGFSAAKAYADFLQTPEVQDKIDKAVAGYGQSNFGAFLVSGAAGSGYRDNWNAYTQAISNQYFLNHGKDLQQKIQQQRSIAGDPFTRFNAVNRAVGLTPQESQLLMNNVRPLVNLNNTPDSSYLADKATFGMGQYRDQGNFDAIANIVRNHRFEDPQVEHIRKKVASQWDAMDTLVGNVFDSVNK